MKLTFIDCNCPAPYDEDDLQVRPLGGTEASVIRVARALAARDEVVVLQHRRTASQVSPSGVVYAPIERWRDMACSSDHLIFVQKPQHVDDLVRSIPRARRWLWVHNWLPQHLKPFWRDHLRHSMTWVCVSRTHAQATSRYVQRHWINRATLGWAARGGVQHQYNPVDEQWLSGESARQRDPHKLLCFSSAHKGLRQILQSFELVRRRDPRWRLFLADPGYAPTAELDPIEQAGVHRLGSLSPQVLRRHVRDSFCIFYPQTTWPETFGLVFAESNAAGTPVLAHDFGAAAEVLHPANAPSDLTDHMSAVHRLERWRDEGAPRVGPNPQLETSQVAACWREMLLQAPA